MKDEFKFTTSYSSTIYTATKDSAGYMVTWDEERTGEKMSVHYEQGRLENSFRGCSQWSVLEETPLPTITYTIDTTTLSKVKAFSSLHPEVAVFIQDGKFVVFYNDREHQVETEEGLLELLKAVELLESFRVV